MGPGAHDPVHVNNRVNTRQTERLMCETPTPGNAPKYLKNSATRADGTVDEYAAKITGLSWIQMICRATAKATNRIAR